MTSLVSYDYPGNVRELENIIERCFILCRGNGIYAGSNNLTEPFDVIGILDQESTNLKGGYRLYVMNYDGNGSVLAGREPRAADKPGDTNLDGAVNFADLAKLAEDWLR